MMIPAAARQFWDLLCRHRLWLLGGLMALTAADVAWVTITYLVYPGYLDHGEPSVALISWRLLDGVPAFQDFDAPGRVGNVYGPMTYAVHAVAFALAGASTMAGKAASLLAAALVPVVVWLGQRHRGREAAAVGALIAAALLLVNVPTSIWNRPDSMMALLVALAVWAANASRPDRAEWAKSLAIAVAGGVAVGMKLHAGVYFVPIVLYHCMDKRRRLKTLAAIAAVGLAVVLLPFAFEVFPAAAFLSWIARHVGKANPIESILTIARYSIIYLVPAGFYWAAGRGAPAPADERVYFWSYLTCLALIGYPATKAGAGIYYFLPFTAIVVDLVLRHAARMKDQSWRALVASGVVAVAIFALGVPVQKRYYRALHWQEVRAIIADIHDIMRRYPDRTIEMGLGDDVRTYPRTYYKTVLVMAGHPYTIDFGPAMEVAHMGIPMSDDTLAMIRGCSTDIWLIPKGERPLAMTNYYGTPAVDPATVAAFTGSYGKERSFAFFDVWACKR